jgi:HK97 family phage portal protein
MDGVASGRSDRGRRISRLGGGEARRSECQVNISAAFNRAFRKRMSVADLDRIMDMMVGGGPETWSGNRVDENSSLQNPTVWACVRVISEAFAAMPTHVYRRTRDGGKEIARDHYLYPIVHDQVNPELTAFDYWELAQAHLCTWGNHYSLMEFDQVDRVKALWPLPPDRVKVTRDKVNDPREYSYRQNDGRWMPVESQYIFHVAGLGYDGRIGYSPIGLHRQTIGAANAVQEFSARLFGNGVRSSGFLEHPTTLTKEAGERLAKSFSEQYAGLKNAHKVILLEGGMKFNPSSINPDDAQFLETRKFSRSEIAGMFRVPAHMIGDLEKATFSNIEQQSLEFVTFTLVPWMARWEAAIRARMLGPQARTKYFVEIDANGLMRGDAESRAKFYQLGINSGWLKPNEARRKENFNEDPAGDVYFRPLNTGMVRPDGTLVSVLSGPAAAPAAKGANE